MMGNIESAKRLANALTRQGVEMTDDLGDKSYDILHVHTPVPPSNIIAVKNAKKMGIPVVLHAHTTAEDAEGTWTGSTALSGLTGRYLTYFYNLGDIVLAPSSWTKERLQARGVVVPIRVLSNGVDLERFRFQQERRQRFRSRYGIPNDSIVAYSIGVVCVKKGVETLPLVSRELPALKFVWVGRRSMLYHPLKVRRAMKKCPENVRFMHDVEDIVDAHCGCDIFFTPSLAENQGMAVMEAMAVGRPVVARNLQAYDGLLTNGESAIICSSASEFVSAIDRLTRDTDLTRDLIENGRAAIGAHDLGKVAAELITIYNSLLEGSGKKNEVTK
jgi:1,2-diacylglycerol-3-alpha-glucose alpha-1,2-glucosyltransferase